MFLVWFLDFRYVLSEAFFLLGYETSSRGNRYSLFRHNVESPSSGVEISKTNLLFSFFFTSRPSYCLSYPWRTETQAHSRIVYRALPNFHKTLKFIKIVTTICQLTQLWTNWVNTTSPLLITLRLILIYLHKHQVHQVVTIKTLKLSSKPKMFQPRENHLQGAQWECIKHRLFM
jgi:hypothetical protein